MKKIEIDSELVTDLLDLTVTLDFRLSDNPFISFIKADEALTTMYVLGIISKEELINLQELLYVNYSYFTEMGLNKEGEIN